MTALTRRVPSSVFTMVGHLEAPKKATKVAGDSSAKHLDSYVPNTEIVSRKYTRLSEVSEETAIRYLKKLMDKYASGSIIAEVSYRDASTKLCQKRQRGANLEVCR